MERVQNRAKLRKHNANILPINMLMSSAKTPLFIARREAVHSSQTVGLDIPFKRRFVSLLFLKLNL